MKYFFESKRICGITLTCLLLELVNFSYIPKILAQSIQTDLENSTQTQITQNGNQFNINGGSISSDGSNLFHSFQEFNLDQNQIANFLTNPQIQNVLGRVTGGNPSLLDGLIQVIGSKANLYLMNPAGIIFGSNFSLNVPADFTATTATGMGLNNNWFNAFGDNNYQDLTGNPQQFAFDLTTNGVIINNGNITINNEHNVNLIGGTVVNTGIINSPEGNINIMSVAGTNTVKISQVGSLLSLEIAPPRNAQGNIQFSPLQLPELLTGTNLNTDLSIFNNQIFFNKIAKTIPVIEGTTIINGNLDVSGTNGGNINILGEKIGVLASNINANGVNNGGTILIGGDYQGQGNILNADHTLIDENTNIHANSLVNGDGGKVIVWADNTTQFYGNINAMGGNLGGDGGFVETSGKNILTATGNVKTSAINGQAGTWLLDPNDITILDVSLDLNVIGFPNFISTSDSAIVTALSILTALNSGTNVSITTTNNIGSLEAGLINVNADLIKTSGSDATLTLNAHSNININNPITSTSGKLNLVFNGDTDNNGEGNVVLNQTIDTNGGFLNISGAGNSLEGVAIQNVVNTSGGNINITGKSNLNYGIVINQPLNTGSGNIFLNGNSNNLIGVKINNSLTTTTGNIEIIGNSNNSTQAGISVNQPITGNGNIILTTDRPQILNNIQGTGNLIIRPQTSNSAIEIGQTGDTIAIFLEGTTELPRLLNGFNSITLGSDIFANKITFFNNLTFNDNLIVKANGIGGNILSTNSNIFGNNSSITLEANQNINTGNITANGNNIILSSTNGSIITTSGILDTSSNFNGGNITINTNTGNINTKDLISSSNGLGMAGNINLLVTNGTGTINTSAGSVIANSQNNGGGNINLTTNDGNITTNLISARSLLGSSVFNTDNGGNIILKVNGTTGNIFAGAGGIFTTANDGNGGNIIITTNGGNITTNSLNSSSFTFAGNGGNIELKVNGGSGIINASASNINTSSLGGIGGNVLLSANNNIVVNSINTQSQATGVNTGQGGNVTVNTNQFFRVLGTFNAVDNTLASISTIGKVTGGNVLINHGGNGIIPFIVGDATINGTAGKITTGSFFINPTQSFLNTTIIGNISIISVTPPPITPPITPPSTPSIPPISNIILNKPNNINKISNNLDQVDRNINFDRNLPRELRPREEAQRPPLPPDRGQNVGRQTPENRTIPIRAEGLGRDFSNYLGLGNIPIKTLTQTQTELSKIQQETGINPALLYIFFKPKDEAITEDNNLSNRETLWQFNTSNQEQFVNNNTNPQPTDEIELVLVTPSGDVIQKRLENAQREEVMKLVNNYRSYVTNVRRGDMYLEYAQALYKIFITPIEPDLQTRKIDNISFIMDSGLRSLPVAALNDGKNFLVEKYSLGIMPSFSLTNSEYKDIRETSVLAMGADTFTEQNPLPAVPIELSVITNQIWQGEEFLNEQFTLSNFQQIRANNNSFGILHLATHGEFQPGKIDNSYIQFWDQKLSLNQLSTLKLNDPQIDLLVLSACRTALGDNDAELGFAGLAIASGAKSALGSLWYVSDQGTLALMTEFYEDLKKSAIKTEALRQAQIGMLTGKVRYENGQLITENGNIPIPENLNLTNDTDLTHPYYWSAFTMIGNPW